MNLFTFFSIQTWHRQIDHLEYQNIIRLPKVADDIDIKKPIWREIFGDCMKRRQQRKPSYELMSHSTKYSDHLNGDLSGSYPISRISHWFFLSIWDGATGEYHTKPITTKDQFVKQNANLKINWSIYVLILEKNLPTKLLKNLHPKGVLNGSLV